MTINYTLRDASTPTNDFLIAPHPHYRGLYIASGGSFHGYKFLPVIGKYISEVMLGTLHQKCRQRWNWHRSCRNAVDAPSVNDSYEVKGGLKDLLKSGTSLD